MAAVKRFYRAENFIGLYSGETNEREHSDERRHRDIMAEMSDLKAMLSETASQHQPLDPETVGEQFLARFREELSEAAKLKVELDAMYEAIAQTKREIATLHHTTGSEGDEMHRVTNELDAVVDGTEGATETILCSAEVIDEMANTLSARLAGQDQELANDIQDNVVKIFEACNFQDLTGQRITKVVATLRFVEDRIIQMMNIWGGIETFQEIEIEQRDVREGDATLLNGPALETDTDVASQDDIDALFA